MKETRFPREREASTVGKRGFFSVSYGGYTMDAIPEMAPISDLQVRQDEILAALDAGPVILTQGGRAAAVLVSPKQWNELFDRLEFLEDSLDAVEIKARIDAGEEPVKEWSGAEAERDALPA
jgi:PHD/YefM family antitoxin component YafN of YafNO toxin-antitoxin module